MHAVPLIASGIRSVLTRSGEFELMSDSARIADVLVADLDIGLRVLESKGSCRNVLLVAQDDREVPIRRALARGARGILLHTCGVEELVAAVKALGSGGTAFAPQVASRIVQSFASEPLTERELEVLQLLVQGFADKEVAKRLLIAMGTVKSHVRSILSKLGAARRAEAVAIAQRRGLARLDRLT